MIYHGQLVNPASVDNYFCTNIPEPGYAKLRHVVFPSTVTVIGDRIMQYSREVEDVTILATMPPELKAKNFFNNYTNGGKIYVPAGSVDAYKAAPNWSKLASRIYPIP